MKGANLLKTTILNMKFNISSELSYEVFSPTTFIFNIQAAVTAGQQILEEFISINSNLNFQQFSLNNSDARFIKMEVGQGITFTISYQAVVSVSCCIIEEAALKATSVIALDNEVLPYLSPSRHCQSDKLVKMATKEFGNLQNEFYKVQAITDWIFNHVDYISGTTDAGTSAYDTLIQRQGVCKDFAHLGIALCRALDIPARYFTGYACNLYPPDFHACFEAYVGGHWLFFDPTKLVPVNGLVKIANSKDAAEAAVASIFGNANCTYLNVQCSPNEDGFTPLNPFTFTTQGLCYH